MNIQSVNVLSGSENVTGLQLGLSELKSGESGFASALLQQIGLLQNGVAGQGSDLAAIQSWVEDAAANGGISENLQNLAALLGNNLPTVNQPKSDIDLEETLQTLGDVLQQIQQLETDGQASLTANTQMATTQTDEAVSTQPKLIKETNAESADDLSATLPLTPMALLPIQPEVMAEQMVDSAEFSGLLTTAKKPALILNQQDQAQNVPIDKSEIDGADAQLNRIIGATQADQSNPGPGKEQQNTAGLNLKPEALTESFDETTSNVELNKSNAGVSADIARMGGFVRSEAPGAAPTAQSGLQKHFADPAWQQELGDKLVWMYKQSVPTVELRLNPEHLGPVLVKIDVSQDQASVAFTTQHLAVKEAIEAALPKLREMLGGQQLNLSDVNVSQQQSEQKQQAREFFQMAGEQNRRQTPDADPLAVGAVNEAQDIVDEIEAGRAIATNGLLSLFA